MSVDCGQPCLMWRLKIKTKGTDVWISLCVVGIDGLPGSYLLFLQPLNHLLVFPDKNCNWDQLLCWTVWKSWHRASIGKESLCDEFSCKQAALLRIIVLHRPVVFLDRSVVRVIPAEGSSMSDKRLKLQNFSLDWADTWMSQSSWQWRNHQSLAESLFRSWRS